MTVVTVISVGLALSALSVAPTVSSEAMPEAVIDLGVIGRMYPIRETDLLKEIRARLDQLERSGGLEKWMQQGMAGARAYVAAPPGRVLPAVIRPALRDVTPVSHAAVPASGRRLLFIDGTDAAQLHYAEQQWMRYRERMKLVLIAGAPLALRQRGLPAYFDQRGVLAQRIGVVRVPSAVYVRAGRLLIEEVVVDE